MRRALNVLAILVIAGVFAWVILLYLSVSSGNPTLSRPKFPVSVVGGLAVGAGLCAFGVVDALPDRVEFVLGRGEQLGSLPAAFGGDERATPLLPFVAPAPPEDA